MDFLLNHFESLWPIALIFGTINQIGKDLYLVCIPIPIIRAFFTRATELRQMEKVDIDVCSNAVAVDILLSSFDVMEIDTNGDT